MKSYGSDTIEPQKDGTFLLECPIPKGWIGRRPGTQTSAEHPGTAVRWEEHVLEVLQATPGAHGGMRYRLAPWDGRHAIRVVCGYDAEAEEEHSREQSGRLSGIRKRRITLLLAPLAGLLPA